MNNWGFYMTLDTERGILYTVFGSPASDYYGGDREGNNLFGTLSSRSKQRPES